MPITTTTVNYYDDFSTPDATNGKTPNDKNYLKILFKPGYSVQVRELNQMQSMLQSQIDKFGGSVWKDGVAVIGGNVTFDNNISAIDVLGSSLTSELASTITSVETTIAGADVDVRLTADVIGYKPGVNGVYTLYIRYKNSVTRTADQKNVETFSDGAELDVTSTSNAVLNLVVVGPAKFAAGIFLDKGVFFTKGCFVATPSQSVFIDKTGADEKINGFGKLNITENYVTANTDSTLYDNANDTLNFKAPGADRYSIDLGLKYYTKDQEANNEQESISLITIVDNLVVEVIRDRYTSLDRELAKRTFEESGNYALNPFKLELKECFKDNSSTYSLGRYTSNELSAVNISDTNGKGKYYIGVDSSVAYVDGFRVEPSSKTELLSDKARTVFPKANEYIDINLRADIGNYVVGTFGVTSALPNIQKSDEVYNIGVDKIIIGNVNQVLDKNGVLKLDNVFDLEVGMPVTGSVTGSIFNADTTITEINRAANTVTVSNPLIVPAAVDGTVAARSADTLFATITKINHGLVTGNVIYVTTALSTSSTTIPIGTYGVTVIDLNTFTIITANTNAITPGNISYQAILANTVATFASGTTKIKAVEPNFGSTYRFYLYDIVSSFNVSNINRIRKTESPGVNIIVTTPIAASNSNANIFALPYTAIENVDAGVEYNALLFRSGIVAATNTVTFSLPSNHTLAETSPGAFILTINGVVTSITNVTGGTSPGTDVTLTTAAAIGATFNCIIPATVIFNAISKTLKDEENIPKVGTDAVNNVFTLPHAQIIASSLVVKYNSVNNTVNNVVEEKIVTSDFTIFDDGQRDNYLTNVKVQYNGTKTLGASDYFFFSYDYLANDTSTGFSTVNSYPEADVLYSDIPSYKGVRLTDVIDFRPVLLSGAAALTTLTIPNPGSLISCGVRYYLPKIDKVVVGNNNKVSVIQGVPSLNPIEPVTPDNTMALYTLEIPAYTYNVSDITLNYINNRRYTMRDISSLDQRLSNVEYYTALSLLEKSANDRSIGDAFNASRFKNGIIVDAFVDFNSADTNNSAYNASIDRAQGILRPAFTTSRIDLKPKTVDDGVTINTNSATLSFNELPYITQKYASESESVNPYDIATYVGTLDLSPSSDEWQETKQNVTNNLDFNSASTFQDLGTVWGEWKFSKNVYKGKLYEKTDVNRVLQIDAIATETINDINITIIPFIRSRKIYFSASNLKPNTIVYPFFDNINVSSYVKQTDDNNRYVEWKNRTDGEALYTGQTLLVGNGACKTDAAGNLQGMFVIPNNNSLKFKSGARQFKLSDNISNNANSETTYAVANYTAAATTKTVNSTLTTTRVPKIVERNIRQEKKVHKDPLAQSFLIDDIQSPSGVFLSSVELYFERKSETLPVNVAIVTMENGFPSQNIVPFSEVTLTPYTVGQDGKYTTNEIVKTSNDASIPTIFKFSDPVYLNPGNEYALVVTSNDASYRAFVSRVGGNNIPNNKRIDKNPYSGVLFMSANSSTWTADQNRDLKFTLNRAAFDTNTLGGSITFRPESGVGIQSVTITNIGSGYTSVPNVKFSDPASGGTTAKGNAIFDSVTGTVIGVTITNAGSGYTSVPNVTFDDPQSGIGTAKGTVNLVSIPISTFVLTQNNIEPYATNIAEENKATSIFNTLTLDNNILNVLPAVDYNLNSTVDINSTNKDSIKLATDFTSINDYVSPLIDLDNVSLLAVSNIIGTPQSLIVGGTDTETLADAGTGLSRYITRTVELNQPADQLSVFVDVNRPSAGSYIKVYAKTNGVWSEMIPANATTNSNPQNQIPISADPSVYSEVEYKTTKAFETFAVKIVFVSDAIYTPTTVRNFRAIATSGIQ